MKDEFEGYGLIRLTNNHTHTHTEADGVVAPKTLLLLHGETLAILSFKEGERHGLNVTGGDWEQARVTGVSTDCSRIHITP